ncbi:hypothetical protein [Nonomuraea roseola]|uniref:Uncharacterized protein n=1 Tax=Nonomuraea roseola TaxID=46179 RepID=A0ABV5Q374_9ACTN
MAVATGEGVDLAVRRSPRVRRRGGQPGAHEERPLDGRSAVTAQARGTACRTALKRAGVA